MQVSVVNFSHGASIGTHINSKHYRRETMSDERQV
jgi:hypothetical protein